jgi:hypothetical protein
MEGCEPSAKGTVLRTVNFVRDLSQSRHKERPNCLPQMT